MQHSNTAGCILLKFYIKPQHTANVYNLLYVVSYRNSTSNHNMSHWRATSQGVVSYRNSTSNHNGSVDVLPGRPLYLIEILHQTTTTFVAIILREKLYLIEILHQTTTQLADIRPLPRCILSKFYIKPQHRPPHDDHRRSCILSKFYIKPQLTLYLCGVVQVVSYRNSTSNHNSGGDPDAGRTVVSYRNSTSNHNDEARLVNAAKVVSYRNSTSNHNEIWRSY